MARSPGRTLWLWLSIFACFHPSQQTATRTITAEFDEGLKAGTTVYRMQRVPGMEYALHRDAFTDAAGLFEVSSDGIIKSKVVFDYEDDRRNQFDLVILSQQTGNRYDSGVACVVRVNIRDMNDNRPTFAKEMFVGSVSENSPNGTVVLGLEDLFAEDPDSGVFSVEAFDIVAGNEAGRFEVFSPNRGELKFLRIQTRGPIDREETASFLITVRASDGGEPKLSSTTQVKIIVLDTNDNAPVFDPRTFSASVNENSKVGTSILQVKTLDKDIHQNSEVYYYFESGDDFFSIHPHTGVVEVASALNFERGNFFELEVVAKDRGKPSHSVKTKIRLQLLDVSGFPPANHLSVADVSQSPPVFEKDSYFVRVKEDFAVGGLIVRVSACQPRGWHATRTSLRYTQLSGDRLFFRLNSKNGAVILIKPLDFERKKSFTLKIKAKMEGNTAYATAKVLIAIEKVKELDHRPVFRPAASQISISEDADKNTTVTHVVAEYTGRGKLKYAITAGSGLGRFQINENGELRPLVRLSAALLSRARLDLVVEARVNATPQAAKLYLRLRVEQRRARRPAFAAARYRTAVRENATRGTFVAVVRAGFHAHFVERAPPLEYSFTDAAKMENPEFVINSATGIITTAEPLDHERKSLYVIDVVAKVKDGLSSQSDLTQVAVHVTDVNDNEPSFPQKEYQVEVAENQGKVPSLLCLPAYDPDKGSHANTIYSITSGNDAGLFSIDPALGLLSVDQGLDYEHQSIHKLVIKATDGGGRPDGLASVNVIVHVQDVNDAPVFLRNIHEVSIKEDAEVLKPLYTLSVVDVDEGGAGSFTCSMTGMDVETMDMFAVGTSPGRGCVLTLRGYLEWSRQSEYHFTVRATDNATLFERKSASAQVVVRVLDTNNHRPMFVQTSYWVSVASDTLPGVSVLQVEAEDLDSDENARVRYATNSNLFAVDRKSGVVTLTGKVSVLHKKYDFNINATDAKQRSAEVAVSVSIHSSADQPPKFAERFLYIEVKEGFNRAGDELHVLRVQDAFGARVDTAVYSLVGGDPGDFFAVHPTTGALTLKKRLDYENAKEHRLVVRASVRNEWFANRNPALVCEAVVVVNVTDVNDNSPRFALIADPFLTTFDRLKSRGSTVAKTEAYDADSGSHGSVNYRLEGAAAAHFQIDNKSGEITTVDDVSGIKNGLYEFSVVATDSSPPFRSSRAAINVQVYDTSPPPVSSLKALYHVSEEVRVGTNLAKFNDKNAKGELFQYSLLSGNDGRDLCIDTSGALRVQKPLDRERTPAYHLRVHLQRDQEGFAGPDVIINVTDANDNVPKFVSETVRVFVRENLPRGQQIPVVLATDADLGQLEYTIVNAEDPKSEGIFSIEAPGILTTTEPLDREVLEQHVLSVRAQDSGYPQHSTLGRVVVTVQDENDNPPVFAARVFEVWVPFGSEAGTPIIRLQALDEDKGRNGIIRFFLLSGNKDRYVSINSGSGEMILHRQFVALQPITVKVMARDLGRNSLNSSCDVIITPLPVRGPPLFVADTFTGSVTENRDTAEVLQVAASSEYTVVYGIVSGNNHGIFNLDPETGVISTTKPLDHEQQTQYILVVRATDTVNRFSEVKVVVDVVNENDNGPRLTGAHGGVFEGEIPRNAARNSKVMILEVYDRDANDTLSFDIQEADARQYFQISSSGSLSTLRLLTGLVSPYEFEVVVQDNGVPPRKVAARVRIILLQHQLPQQIQFSRQVLENIKPGTPIMTLQPARKVPNSEFSIVSPRSTPFYINPSTGVVSAHKSLDYEHSRQHTFIVQVQNTRDTQDYTNLHVNIEVLDTNDNAPTFVADGGSGNYLAYINRHAIDETKVVNVTANDADSGLNAVLRYRLLSGGDDVFAVDQSSGVLRRRGRSALQLPWYNMTVQAYDLGRPSLSSQAVVSVQVGEFPPEFSQQEYEFSFGENNERYATVGWVRAKSFSGATLSFHIVQGENPKFNLNSFTGELQAAVPLDFERDSTVFLMRVRATETNAANPLSADVSVRLFVMDVNDNAPVFTKQRYVSTLPESTPVGTTVASLTAVDKDSGINGQVRYNVTNPAFAVNPYTGHVVTAGSLDYERFPSYTVNVWAVDSGNPALSGSCTVVVQLKNVNDNPPVFTQSLYQVELSEDARPNEVVVTVQASDMDNDAIAYSIISGDEDASFTIHESTGVVRLVNSQRLVLTGPYYTLNISATDGYHVVVAILIVAIQDINNHKPEFTNCSQYRPHILEGSAPGQLVLQVRAEDRDAGANGRVQYEIEQPAEAFEINPDTGIIKSAARFDREEKRFYQIIVKGKDGGKDENDRLEGICQIEIEIDDVNDEAPKFDDLEYTVTVPENTVIGGSVLRVSAKDPDAGNNGSVWYALSTPNDDFAVDDFTGLVTTKRKLQLGKHSFEVVAWDKGRTPNQGRTVVVVEVFGQNEKPPSFTRSVYRAHVREDVSTGHEVITVNTTNMDDMIYYSIETHPSPFSIDPTSGVVRTSIPLDYEKKPNYTLTIKATTSYPTLVARAVLHIILEDVNDSPPSFSLSGYEVHVNENEKVGTFVVQVSAEDPDVGTNGLVTYALRRSQEEDAFQIDPVTGVITTKQEFDREQRPEYILIVTARDNGEKPKYQKRIVKVLIKDKNDNAPVFLEPYYNVTVPEGTHGNTRLLTVSAEDKDVEINGRVNYYITSGNEEARFEVKKDNIFVARPLDRETQEFYKLSVTASDGKNSNEVTVHVQVIDVNDNDPVFSNNTYEASVRENMPRNAYVVTFSATDVDLGPGGNFTFEISGQGLAAFYVDKETGVLRTNGPLDREEKKRYDFLALAKDSDGRTGYADVVINVKDVNDNAPHFPDSPYVGYVQEEQLRSVDVMDVSAVDEDDPNEGGNAVMSYQLLDDADGFFRIKSDTGVIQTTGKRLDRERKDRYTVVVKATDQGKDINGTALWGAVNVTIFVLDTNDHKPKFRESIFHARVSEHANIDSSVMALNATDGDTGTNARLHYRIADSPAKQMFKLVEGTGELQVARSLDYEETKFYRLNVIVTDSGSPSHSDTAEVHVTVEDYNDCAPRFHPVMYTVAVPEDERTGTFLLRVNATDADTGSNKFFTFSINAGDPSDRFYIHEDTGELFLNAQLDRETVEKYRLTVRATNKVAPYLHGDARVEIKVIDRNDNGPVFDKSTLHSFIKENKRAPVVVGTLVVTDPDHEDVNGGPFTFSLDSHNDIFTLDNKTGVLRTRVPLDREKENEYKVAVSATDNGGMTTRTVVNVVVEDVNDNQHEKGKMELTINAFEGKFPGGDVGQVYVKDQDTDDERLYEAIWSSSPYFSVWKPTGKVRCKPNPPLGVHKINVTVSDVDSDFTPVISEVSILVKNIPAEALNKSVAVRLSGLSREDIVAEFLASFKKTVAGILETLEENVDLFSVQMAPGPHQAVDLRFAAHGSPYYAPERITALLKNARPKLTSIGKPYNIKYEVIGVDKCLHERCEAGGCTSFLTADGNFEVISAAEKTFLSLVVYEEAVCAICGAKRVKSNSCQLRPCLSGGTCMLPAGQRCRCPLGFDGPRCELTTRSFQPGEWVWLRPLKLCNTSSFYLEFATKNPTGLILYHGPTSPVEEGDVYDFVAVQLLNGRVLVSMSLGDVSDVIDVSVSGGPALNDGKWHSVRVQMNGTIVVVTVDDCNLAKVTEEDEPDRSEDKSLCEVRGGFKSTAFKFLNPDGPLQIGGAELPNLPYPQLRARHFVGCIRHVTNDHVMYDLAAPSKSKGSNRGCPVMDQHCRATPCRTPSSCVPSWSGHACRCPLGYTGSACEHETEPVSYDENSFTRYFFYDEFKYDLRETGIQLKVRTRDADGGILLFSEGSEKNEVSLLELAPHKADKSRLIVNYTFNLGDYLEGIQLDSVNVGDGKWHEISVGRKRTEVTLTVDQEFSATVQSRGHHTLFRLDPIRTYIGGLPTDSPSGVASRVRRQAEVVRDFVGCLNDVRYNGYSLHFHGIGDIGKAQSSGVTKGCHSREVCFPDSCPDAEWCHDVWRAHACLPRLCLSRPCRNGGTCYEGVDSSGANKYRCICTPKFQGAQCETERAVVASTADPALESGLIIGICVLIVTLVLSVCLTIIHIKYSRGKAPETPEDDNFRRDNVVDYREGGGEEDIDDDGSLFRDMFEVFGEAHTPEKKAARREGRMTSEQPCKTSHDQETPCAAHCACAEPLHTELLCSCGNETSPRSTEPASAVAEDIFSSHRESPEGREDGQLGRSPEVLRRPAKFRRRQNPGSCECQGNPSTPDMPSPVHFLPVDAIKLFSTEGRGSVVSLSTLGHSETDTEIEQFPWQRESLELKDRFDRLARIYEGVDSPETLSWDYCGNFH